MEAWKTGIGGLNEVGPSLAVTIKHGESCPRLEGAGTRTTTTAMSRAEGEEDGSQYVIFRLPFFPR